MTEAADMARFWAKVRKAEGGGCWEWTGTLTHCARAPLGYGNFSVKHRSIRAHRFIWAALNGPIPDGAFVCHRCDNPKCVRPDHLFLGSPKDNHRDMTDKGRARPVGPRGERAPAAKLTEADVREIRSLRQAGEPYKRIALRFGISREHACRIACGHDWKHLA